MARRFEFRLQTLLRVRQLREREAKRKVSAKRAEIAHLDSLNEQTTREIWQRQADLLAAQQKGEIDLVELQRGRNWIAHLRRTIATRQSQRAELVDQLRGLQEQLREARTQTRIIEKLRDRRQKDHDRSEARREQDEADELAQQLHGFDEWHSESEVH